MKDHGDHEKELYRTYLADFVACIAVLWGGEGDGKRGSLPVVAIFLATSFCFWSSLAAYFIYIWFIK